MSVRGETMSDSQSDTTGRGSSLGSREDLNELAALLGLSSSDYLAQDRFRVDRKRLEQLLFGNENEPEAAAKFFDRIMKESTTHITWPSRLKLGAKSKKDPHIRVIGRPADVKTAREKILASLDTRGSRVNMKIDVSYTDHSHIIGKGGLTIRQVMEETGCHIHFPDSNRSNPTEKSNQVSIAGEVAGVERARARVRELTPLIFCFELPILGALMMPTDSNSLYIKTLQERFNVQVMFRTRQKLNSTLVVVKGCEWEVRQVKTATQLLIKHMCKSLAGQVSVQMMVEISPQHHNIVLGRNNENLKGIMQRTNTQIIFLDPNDPNIPSLKKSNVTITGTIHNVYMARQQLIGSLPIVLMFDVPENSIVVDSGLHSELMNKLDLLITTRHKPKQNILSFIIKGIERNVDNIYEARRKLIAPNDSPVEVHIPSTYHNPNPSPVFKTAWPSTEGVLYGGLVASPLLLGATPLLQSPEPTWPASPHYHMLHHAPAPHLHHYQHLQPHSLHPIGHFSYSSLSLPDLPVYSSLSSNTSTLSSPSASPRTVSPVPPSQATTTSSTTNLANCLSEQNINKTEPLGPFNGQAERKAPGFDRPLLTPEEYQKMKQQAFKAMQRPPKASDLRNPSSVWSGYGFSQSSPSYVLKKEQQLLEEERISQDIWTSSNKDLIAQAEFGLTSAGSETNLAASNYLDSVSAATISTIVASQPKDIRTVLTVLGLESYSRLFETHEIDLSVFRTLTDLDLKEIGVSAFGARRKILLCIAELNRRQRNPFSGSAAPGAERKSSSNTSLDDSW